MFCTKCGKQIPDHAKFCKYCGASTTGPVREEPVTFQKKNKTAGIFWMILLVLFLLILIGAGIFLLTHMDKNEVGRNENETIHESSDEIIEEEPNIEEDADLEKDTEKEVSYVLSSSTRYSSSGKIRDTWEYTYDEDGNCISYRYTDEEGTVREGRYEYEYDDSDVMTVRKEYTDSGILSCEIYYDEEENVRENIEYIYDDQGRLTEEIHFDQDENEQIFTYRGDGIYFLSYRSEKSGEQQIITEYREDGSVEYTEICDKYGQLIREAGYDSNGQMEWENKWTYEYDEEGNIMSWSGPSMESFYITYDDEDENDIGKIVFHEDGSVTVTAREGYEYIEGHFLKVDSEEYENFMAVTSEEELDENGNMIVQNWYDAEGELVYLVEYEYLEVR